MARLIICSDLECKVYIDTELYGTANAGEEFVADLDRGAYWVECVSAENSADRTDFDFRTDGSEHTERRDIALKPIRYKRLIAQYDSVGEFCCGFAKATKNGSVVGFINPNGDLIYDDATPFGVDKLCVCKNGLWGVINSAGEYVIEYQYQKITPINNSYAIFNTQGKFGLLDFNGVIIISPKYDNLKKLWRSECLGCQLNGRWGVLDYGGGKLTPLKFEDVIDVYNDVLVAVYINGCQKYYNIKNGDTYDWIRLLKNDYVLVRIGDKCGYIKNTGEEVIPIIYHRAYDFFDDRAKVMIDNKYGYINRTGEVVVPIKYDNISSFFCGVAQATLNHKLGFVDSSGKELTPFKYDLIVRSREDLIKVILNNRYGFVNTSGVEIIPPIYDSIDQFDNNLAKVSIDGKWGYINKKGEEIIPIIYDSVGEFEDNLVKVSIDGKLSYIHISKNEAENIFIVYDIIDDFSIGPQGEWAKVKKDNKKGFINRKGEEVVPCKYSQINDFFEGLAAVCIGGIRIGKRWCNGEWGYIDQTGEEIIPCIYNRSNRFCGDLAMVNLDGRWGYIDKTGKEVISCKYDNIYSIYDGTPVHPSLKKVELDGKYGLIDKIERKEIVPCTYREIHDFHEDLAMVNLDGKWGYIDKTGKTVVCPRYDYIGSFHNGLAVVKYNKKEYFGFNSFMLLAIMSRESGKKLKEILWGYVDKTGKEVIPCQYDSAKNFKDGLAKVELDGKSFYINRNGEKVKDA